MYRKAVARKDLSLFKRARKWSCEQLKAWLRDSEHTPRYAQYHEEVFLPLVRAIDTHAYMNFGEMHGRYDAWEEDPWGFDNMPQYKMLDPGFFDELEPDKSAVE